MILFELYSLMMESTPEPPSPRSVSTPSPVVMSTVEPLTPQAVCIPSPVVVSTPEPPTSHPVSTSSSVIMSTLEPRTHHPVSISSPVVVSIPDLSSLYTKPRTRVSTRASCSTYSLKARFIVISTPTPSAISILSSMITSMP